MNYVRCIERELPHVKGVLDRIPQILTLSTGVRPEPPGGVGVRMREKRNLVPSLAEPPG
jgi:hypothetical protein